MSTRKAPLETYDLPTAQAQLEGCPFAFLATYQAEEFITLKNLLSSDKGDSIFVVDDTSQVRDITDLADDEILHRINTSFKNKIAPSQLDLPLIALIDYLWGTAP